MPPTTIGRVMLQSVLPPEYADRVDDLTKDKLDDILADIGRNHPDKYKEISSQLIRLGGRVVMRTGTTLRLSDTSSPIDTKPLFAAMDAQVEKIRATPGLTDEQRDAEILKVYAATNKQITDATYKAALAAENPFALQVRSKARGNPAQLAALMTTPGLYTDAHDNVIPVFVRRSFAQGLRPHEYAASAYGARKSIIATKFCLAEGTLVRMADFSVRAIEDVEPGEDVLGADFRGRVFPVRVTHTHDNGSQPVSDYTFRELHGTATTSVSCTDAHPLLVIPSDAERSGHRQPAGALGIGDCVAVAGFAEHPYRYTMVLVDNYRYERVYDLTVDSEYHLFVLANGLVVGNSTQKAGFLGKQLTAASMPLLVTEEDCEAGTGMPAAAGDIDNIGALLAQPVAGFAAGTPITRHVMSKLKAENVDNVVLRSPITCGAGRGVCRKCAGLREDGKLPPIGYNLGINGAAPLTDRVAQGQLNCLEEGTLVRMADYSVRRIEHVRIGEFVLGANVHGVTFPVRVTGVWDQGTQPVNEYVYGLGNTRERITVVGTAIHEVLCSTQKSGCRDAAMNNVPRKLPLGYKCRDIGLVLPTRHAAGISHTEPYAAVIGMMIGDGCRTASGYPVFSCADTVQIADVRRMLEPLGFAVKKCKRSLDWRIVDRTPLALKRDSETGRILRGARNRMRVTLQRVGLWATYAYQKRIPREAWSWSDESLAQLVAGYLVTDGSVYTCGAMAGVSFGSVSKELLEDLRDILAVRFCVYGSALTRTGRAGEGGRVHDMWAFTITRNEAVRRLYACVSPHMFGVKRAKWDTLVSRMPPVKRVHYRCPRKSVSETRRARCWDLTVDHPDHLFVLANGAIVSNTKHSGGAASAKAGDDDYSGFEVIKQLTQVPTAFPDAAALASLDGRVEGIVPAPQGGQFVIINGEQHYVRPGADIRVKPGDVVEAGDQLSGGIVNPREIVATKGLGAGRLYLTERLTSAFRRGGYAVNRRNVEVNVRSMLDHMESDGFDDDNGIMPGDIVSYGQFQRRFRPRPGAAQLEPKAAIGRYLEQPVLHHTIGTRVTPKVAEQLTKYNVKNVMAHDKPLDVRPSMQSLQDVPHFENDWLAQMGSNYLERSLLTSAHRGASSNVHGLHPIPALAKGTELGKPPKGEVGY